ncbi:MAG: transposase [Flavobacteriales bacterium]|nr:transposase [Flavobacteriales bacterium]
MTRRKFTVSFKLQAIKLGEEKQNIAQAARELGVKASLIHRWKREQQEFTHNSFFQTANQLNFIRRVSCNSMY